MKYLLPGVRCQEFSTANALIKTSYFESNQICSDGTAVIGRAQDSYETSALRNSSPTVVLDNKKLTFPIYTVKKQNLLRSDLIILQELDMDCQTFSFQGGLWRTVAQKQGFLRHGVHRAKPVMPGNIINNENTTLKMDNLTHACCRQIASSPVSVLSRQSLHHLL
ncbi:MAG: hypothetical protein ACYSTG_03965 [Planctomycetota bacterium]|jgi:hypothetical protein